jgi:hypothetical protein
MWEAIDMVQDSLSSATTESKLAKALEASLMQVHTHWAAELDGVVRNTTNQMDVFDE